VIDELFAVKVYKGMFEPCCNALGPKDGALLVLHYTYLKDLGLTTSP